MPKLTNYTAPIQAPDTGFQRATPESMGSAVGAGLETIGTGARHLYSQMEEDESRTALVGVAQVRADAAAELDAAQASGAPTDPIKQKMQDKLSAIGENFSTKKGFQSLALHSAQTNMMFDEQANRIAVHRASETAVLQGQQFLEKQSKLLRSNPSALPIILRNTDEFVETVNASPTKRALMAQDLKTQFNMAAVMSSARIDAPGTKERLEAGEWDITPQEREQGVRAAETRIREIRADERAARQDDEYQKHVASEDASQTVLKNLYAGNLTDGAIFNDSDILPNTKEALLHFKEWYTEKQIGAHDRPHPTEMLRLWNLYHPVDPVASPPPYNSTPVLESASASKLNAREAKEATSWVADLKDENNQKINSKLAIALKDVDRAVSGDMTLNWSPQNVAAIQLDYASRVRERMAEMRQRGEKGENPNEVFNSKSKDYVGSPEFIAVSINNIKNKMRQAGITGALSEPVKFPDGVVRRWNNQEPKTDMKNWVAIDNVGGASGAY